MHSKDAGGYQSNEQQNIEFNTYTMNAWHSRWETEAMDKLLYQAEQKTHIINMDNTYLLRGDSKSRMEYLRARMQTSSITPEEIRILEGDNPTGNPALNKFFIQAKYVPIEEAGNKYKPADTKKTE